MNHTRCTILNSYIYIDIRFNSFDCYKLKLNYNNIIYYSSSSSLLLSPQSLYLVAALLWSSTRTLAYVSFINQSILFTIFKSFVLHIKPLNSNMYFLIIINLFSKRIIFFMFCLFFMKTDLISHFHFAFFNHFSRLITRFNSGLDPHRPWSKYLDVI